MTIVSSRVSRIARLVAVGAVAATLLSACIKVEADVTVNPDATASGEFSLELQKDAASFLGISSVDMFAEGISSGEVTGGDNGLGVFQDCTPSESETGYVYACSFENAAFTESDGPWIITQADGLLTFRMQSQSPTEGQDEAASLLGEGSLGSITVTVAFPGTITSTSGAGVEQTSDTTATITGSLTDSMDVTITAESGSGFALSSLLVLLVFAGIIILIVIVVIALVMRRRRAGHELDAATVAAAEAIPVAPGAVALSGSDMAELEAASDADAEAEAEAEADAEADAGVEDVTIVEGVVVVETDGTATIESAEPGSDEPSTSEDTPTDDEKPQS